MRASDSSTASTVPFEITQGRDLVGTQTIEVGGQSIPIQLYPGPTPIYLTLLSSMFMHAAWAHILRQVFAQISVVGGAGGGVAYMAHIGGFVAGLALIFLFGKRVPTAGHVPR